MGTVSPVVAKLAVDRLKQYRRTGTAIGEVYAWGMVGSIIGTFLTGFVLINFLGTKGVMLVLGTLMAFCATLFGPTWHAIWAGIPLGLCALAFTPPWLVDRTVKRVLPIADGARFEKLGTEWGIREEQADLENPDAKYAWIDESNYYFIKINNERLGSGDLTMRTPGARQPDSRLLHPWPPRAARLRLRAHLRDGGLSRGQGQRQDQADDAARRGPGRLERRQAPRSSRTEHESRPEGGSRREGAAPAGERERSCQTRRARRRASKRAGFR